MCQFCDGCKLEHIHKTYRFGECQCIFKDNDEGLEEPIPILDIDVYGEREMEGEGDGKVEVDGDGDGEEEGVSRRVPRTAPIASAWPDRVISHCPSIVPPIVRRDSI